MVVVVEHFGGARRYFGQGRGQLGRLIAGDGAARPRQGQGEAGQGDELGSEGLVEATPISGPARVRKEKSDSRAMVLSATLIRLAICCFWVRQYRRAAMVSAVSPDCDMNSASPPSGMGASR